MDTAHTTPTPQQARDQLGATQARPLASTRDRRVHAVGTAVVGVTIAVLFTASTVVSGVGGVVLCAGFTVVVLIQGWWVERAARTVPRRSRAISRAGIGTSFVLALVAVVPWLNLAAQSAPTTWPMVWAGAGVVAVPALLAAAVIARRRG